MARSPSCGVRGILHRRAHALEEHEVVRRGPGRAAIDDDALDRLAEQRGPVIGLLGAHRPAIDHLHAFDAEQLRPAGGRCCMTLSEVVTSGCSAGVFDGEEDRPLVNMLGMTMK